MALRPLKSVRREQILKTGLEMVREEGFAALSIESVAIRCDCGATTVKRVFRNRETLYREIIKYAEALGDETTVKLGRRLFPD